MAIHRLKAVNVSINDHKSIQPVNDVDFLGFNVSGDGIRLAQALVSTIQSILPPRDKKELQYFIRVANYYLCPASPEYSPR